MTVQWRPKPGQIALVEVLGPVPVPEALTGIVLNNGSDLVIDLGASPKLPASTCEVTASFFTPEALYLVQATATARENPALLELDVTDVLAVQRRASARLRATLPVTISRRAGEAVAGETIDVARGGCRVRTDAPLADDDDHDSLLSLRLGDDDPVVTRARIVEGHPERGGWEYRLAFDGIADADADRLAVLAG